MQSPPPAMRAIGWATRPSAITMCAPAEVAMRAASILVRMPPRESSDAAPPAIASISGVIPLDHGEQSRMRVAMRRRIVEARDVGKQDQQVGARHRGDSRRKPIIVAIADLAGRDRVVLVDDRDGAHGEEPAEGRARVEIAAALLRVLQGQEYLPRDDPAFGKGAGPFARERNLPNRGRSLAVFELERSLRQPAIVRPSAIAPDDTTITLAPRSCRAAMSDTSASSHSRLTAPRAPSTRSDEPTLTTMRLNWSREGG